jgi:hypothetical protein
MKDEADPAELSAEEIAAVAGGSSPYIGSGSGRDDGCIGSGVG